MQCPYCAEEIKDEAIVCRYCGRELSLFRLIKPLLEKVTVLESQIQEMSESTASVPVQQSGQQSVGSKLVAERSSSQQTEDQIKADKKGRRRTWLAAASSPGIILLLAMVGAAIGGAVGSTTLGGGLVVLGLLSPFPVGFWAGVKWPGRHLQTYLFASLLPGLGMFACFAILTEPPGWDYSDLTLGFSLPALFVSGALFGDLYERSKRWQSGVVYQAEREAPSVRLAASLSGSKEPNKTTLVLIQALGPAAIGLIGTSVTAVVTVMSKI